MIVNDNYIKEYEEMSLCDFADELVEPLFTIKKDLTKTIYIHYAEERDKNYELEQENARLKDKIEKIEEWLKYKAEALDTFDIPKRKETGAFWFTTRGEIDGLLELLKEN